MVLSLKDNEAAAIDSQRESYFSPLSFSSDQLNEVHFAPFGDNIFRLHVLMPLRRGSDRTLMNWPPEE